MRARAHAKVNLALAVYAPAADGYHPLRGIFQSVSLADTVSVASAQEDRITVSNDEAPSDASNLAWKALLAARRAARVTQPAEVDITKRIPSGAGLGGGSADAAAVLGLVSGRFGLDEEEALQIAEGLGADVPFAFAGGSMMAEGRGERLTPMADLRGFALAVVVPPFSMSTPRVFKEWDRLGGPVGEAVDDANLPPVLRGTVPIRNDLFPAAASLDSRIAEWHDELSSRWGTEVAMTGSGSALFAFFSSLDEADDAAASIDIPCRLATAVEPVRRGWEPLDG